MNRIRFDRPVNDAPKLFPHKDLIYVPFDLGLAMDVPGRAESAQEAAVRQRFQAAAYQADAAA
jgi:hypothetical protein